MKSSADPFSARRAVRVIAAPETPELLLLLLEIPHRLPIEVRVECGTFALLGLECAGASPGRCRNAAVDFLAGRFAATGFDVASELANGLWPQLIGAATRLAFGRCGPQGLAIVGDRAYPSARAGIARDVAWPRRKR